MAGGTVRVSYAGEPVLIAGASTRFEVTVAADVDLPPGAQLGLARRWPSDWGAFQSHDPAAANYLHVSAGPALAVRWWSAGMHPWHPFDHATFFALPDGLPAGRQLHISAGDAAQGSPGCIAQTFIEEQSPLSIRLLAGPGTAWVEIARPAVQVVGAQAHRLVLTVPSQVRAGQEFAVHLRIEDEWANPTAAPGLVRLHAPIERDVSIPDCGWLQLPVTLHTVGMVRLQASIAGEPALESTSNPVEVVAADAALQPLYWGDAHAQSLIGCGARTIDAFYAHARDFAANDFASHQANCFLVSGAEWAETERGTREAQRPGRFVTLLGVEWSASSVLGGDHNLYFPGDTAPLRRCSHEFVDDRSDLDTDLPHVTDMHANYKGTDTVIAVHVGGRTCDLRWHEPTLDRLLEIHSTHATSEWFLFDALQRGYRMGVIAGSDGVDGRPGASHPGHLEVRNVRGGLTAVSMPTLSRGALWDALRARRCYATTGERIVLRFATADGAQMGDEIRVGRVPHFTVSVAGTAPLECIDFFRDGERLASCDLMAAQPVLSDRVRVAWCGASGQGNFKVARMHWDGLLRVEGARIVRAEPWAFDTPDEGLRGVQDQQVSWRSITAGDWDGVVLELDRPDAAELRFVTEPMTLQTSLSTLGHAPRLFEAGAPMRRLELRRLPQQLPSLDWIGGFDDPDPPPGAHAYWVRVRQSDGAFAWSTPIFTTLDPVAG